MNEFKNGYNKIITIQLGQSFYYSNSISHSNYQESILIDKPYNFRERKINPIKLLDRLNISIIDKKDSVIIDLGQETAGFIDLDIDSSTEQEVLVSFGEHIIDKEVRRIIGPRDFSVEFFLKQGNNKIINPLRRIAGRYLQIYFKHPLKINYLGIRPVVYDHQIIKKDFKDELLNKIYQISIKTLELCMHEHYEDCPWREQCLYVLDSRNQMLCGYYAFKGFEYQKHNVLLLANSLNKSSGLLTLTAVEGTNDYPIPFFSLCYILLVEEYVKYTGDKSILTEVKNTLDLIIKTFVSRIDKNNLIPYFEPPFWNFYEWNNLNAHDGDIFNKTAITQYDLIINVAFVYFANIYNKLFKESIDINRVKQAIKEYFYDERTSLYFNDSHKNNFSQLGLAFITLIGLGNDEITKELLKPNNAEEASLSTRGFIYDALLASDIKNGKFIIEDIKKRYSKMINDGATAFYETEEGPISFGGAGSLCHGWSAIPIYYLNIIKVD